MRTVADLYEIVIIGGGPAGLAAALYAARARRSTLVLERDQAGGRLMTLDWLDDYPGFPAGIAGPDLGRAMAEQAARFGAEIRAAQVQELQLMPRIKLVRTALGDVEAETVIIATGAAGSSERRWDFPYPVLPPNSVIAAGQLAVDGSGHLVVNEWMETELHGVFVAGDVRQYSAQQVITAAGDGATAAIAADRYLSEEH